jgi:hypothetical protein
VRKRRNLRIRFPISFGSADIDVQLTRSRSRSHTRAILFATNIIWSGGLALPSDTIEILVDTGTIFKIQLLLRLLVVVSAVNKDQPFPSMEEVIW